MGNRVVYGNTHSSNGWPMVDQGSCTWVDVPGTNPNVRIQIQNGQPLAILRAFVADLNAYVEHVRDNDTACWTATNSVSTSNHLSGTAVDVDWDSHKFREADAGWNRDQIAEIHRIQEFYEGTVFWGNDWGNPKDAMHFQLASLANGGDINTFGNPHTQDFINRKIRSDGFSTYRRDGAPPPPPPRPAGMTVPLTPLPNGRWTSPSPAWAHLITRESSGNPTIIQQIHDVNSGGNEAEGLFQITPRTWRAHNGTEFAPTARSATPQQQAIVAARIFTRNPSGSDWGAGLPGREDAKQLAAGLVPAAGTPTPTQGDDELSADAEAAIARIEQKLNRLAVEYDPNNKSPSRSFVASDGNPVDSPLGFLWNIDGNVWSQQITWAYLFGVADAEQIVTTVAETGVLPSTWAANQVDAQGRKWISEFGQQYCRGLVGLRTAMQRAFQGHPAAPPVTPPTTPAPDHSVELAACRAEANLLRADNAQLSAQLAQVQQPPPPLSLVDVPPVVDAPPAGAVAVSEVVGSGDFGQVVGRLYNIIDELALADALDIKARATLAATIKILETKNGSAL